MGFFGVPALSTQLLMFFVVVLLALMSQPSESATLSELIARLKDEKDRQLSDDGMLDEHPEDYNTNYDLFGDDQLYGEDEETKRSPWAPTEIRVDEFMQKLRSRMYNNRDKYNTRSEKFVRHSRSLLGDEEEEGKFARHSKSVLGDDGDLVERDQTTQAAFQYASRVFLEGYRAGWQDAMRKLREEVENSVDNRKEEESDVGNIRKRGIPDYLKRHANIRSPDEIHPVYLGLGQHSTSAALSTFASLLAEEEKRIQKNSEQTSNPVRFIGKRTPVVRAQHW